MKEKLAIFGGNFDPIHNGHLWLVRKIPSTFSASVRLIPNGLPPHRHLPIASWHHRINMCCCAVSKYRYIEVGRDESAHKKRYTIDTLSSLYHCYPEKVLLLVLGIDAFVAIEGWKKWQSIFDFAHIIIVNRLGVSKALSPRLKDLCQERRINKAALSHGAGGIYFWQCSPPMISSTDIRDRLANGYHQLPLPNTVRAYIDNHRLYGENNFIE